MVFSIADVYMSADGRYVLPISLADFYGRYLYIFLFICMLKYHTNNKWTPNISKLNIIY